MNESNMTVIGTVVQDPKFSITKNGVPFCSLRVAVNERKFDKASSTWVDSDTTYFSITSWRMLAENIAQSISKGDPIIAVGKLRVREWKTEEKSGIAVELEVVSLGHDLNRGSAQFQRNRKPASSEWEEPGLSAAS
ncbi:MAG: single-stranded DNA-binding protein [Actinomycetota bacterium]